MDKTFRDGGAALGGEGRCGPPTGAEIVATGNPGCRFQIRFGVVSRGAALFHPVEIQDRTEWGSYASRALDAFT